MIDLDKKEEKKDPQKEMIPSDILQELHELQEKVTKFEARIALLLKMKGR
ncbi:MAG: hypothetical protein ACREHC_07250 [Candidatus Levyibacteriota bacterium]